MRRWPLKGNWCASNLMGLNVNDEANEKLGDINELLVDEERQINAVVIGIGGFVGRARYQAEVRR
ncbi:PRC-barrel domain-containing protein [Bradyrhizobium altum]|uniref:PRC-barrel domain-containing protein n=1 Tax=Bradyrhizobium altum TaxID=1571202 RepID=UPI002898B8D8|nr:PRC-barrel domain-containing protein [Bradyrhizobium altum]